MIYVALLRGINVGGNNPVNMKLLKGTFERAGFTDVVTYINSGNIVFADRREQAADRTDLPLVLEQAIAADFGFHVPVIVRSLDEMAAVVEALPNDWTNDDRAKSDVLFLWDEINDRSVLERLPVKAEVTACLYVPGAVLCSVSREHAARSGLNKLVGSRDYKFMTIRNVNTVRRIYAMMLAASHPPGA